MNRRDWMKMLMAGAPAAALCAHGARSDDDDAYLIVTDEPRRVVAELSASLAGSRRRLRIRERRIAPSPQDLTVLRHGTLVDPRTPATVNARIRGLARYLRGRSEPGTYFVSVEPETDPHPASDRVIFELDGRIVESLDRHRTYRHIEIPGRQGTTVFSLDEGRLKVVRPSCRHELCRRSGTVRSGRIVCVPNRLIASIGEPHLVLDAVSG